MVSPLLGLGVSCNVSYLGWSVSFLTLLSLFFLSPAMIGDHPMDRGTLSEMTKPGN